jgi:fructose-1,6-bisphosphatase/inositol monophosphatase family enzyme
MLVMGVELPASVEASDVERYHTAAVELADEARRIVTSALTGRFGVKQKADASLVTEVDQSVERRLRELIGRWFPDHGIIGEEYPPEGADRAFRWIMDPIDGTEEFVHGIPTYGTLLALHHHDTPLVGVIDHPALDLRVSAGRGLGTYRNGQRIRLPELPARARQESIRLVLSGRLNFMRHLDEGRLFEELTREYPNHRIYRAAYAHTIAVTGAVRRDGGHAQPGLGPRPESDLDRGGGRALHGRPRFHRTGRRPHPERRVRSGRGRRAPGLDLREGRTAVGVTDTLW